MFSISSKYAANYIRPYIAPLSQRRLVVVSGRYSNFSSSAETEGENPVSLQQDDHKPSSDPNTVNTDGNNQRQRRGQKTLDVESLGKPGKILVLGDTKRRRVKVIHKDPEKSTDSSSPNNISFLPVESGGKSKSAAYITVLDELRSTRPPGEVLSKGEWVKLRNKIRKGFTLGQLSKYASRFAQSSSPSSASAGQESGTDTGNENEKGEWRAGEYPEATTESLGSMTFKLPEAGDINGKGALAKQVFAERIMRNCWQLEMNDQTGRVEINLPPQAISLLLSSNAGRSWLQELADSHDAKIEPFSSLNLIRVYGTRPACESVRETIKARCSTVRTESINLPFLNKPRTNKDSKIRKNYLQWIQETHHISIQDSGRNSTVSMSYFMKDVKQATIVRKELELANFITMAKPVPFCSYVPSDTNGFMKFISSKRLQVLSWLDRSKKWTRWAKPISPEDFVKNSAPPLFIKHSPKLSTEILQVLNETSSRPSNQPGLEEKLTATVGQCLFERCTEDDVTPLTASQLGELSVPRIWHGWLPKASSFVETLQRFPGEKRGRNFHQFRMIPCKRNGHNLPTLEVELSYARPRRDKFKDDETEDDAQPILLQDIELNSVKVVVEETSIDHLLPECNHDIRFTRTLTRKIFEASTHGHTNPLRTAILSPLEKTISSANHRLPHFCGVPLPASVLRDIPAEGTQSATEGTEAGSDTIVGNYWYPGLRHFHGTLVRSFDFMGEKLNYSHIDGGPLEVHKDDNINLQMLVNRAPSSSLPIPPNIQDGSSTPTDATLEHEFRSFYQTTCRLAFALSQHSRKRGL